MADIATKERISRFKLRNIRVSGKTLWRYIILETESGLCGTGEYTYDVLPPNVSAMMAERAESLVGLAAHKHSLDAIRDAARGFVDYTLLSALDQAIIDIEAQAMDMPVWRHIGGVTSRGSVPLYANINRKTADRSPQGFAASAEHAISQGIRAIKIAPFDGLAPKLCGEDGGRALMTEGMERIAAVSGVIRGTIPLMVDCHWRLSPAAALDCLKDLAGFGVSWFECPLPETPGSIDDLKALRSSANALGMRLAGLEKEGSWLGFKPFVEAGAYDVIMPDIKHAGGYHDILEIAERASAYDVAVSLHNPSGPIAHLASVHATAVLEVGELLESQFQESPLFDAVTEPKLIRTAGNCPVGMEPGLGGRLIDRIEAEEPVDVQ